MPWHWTYYPIMSADNTLLGEPADPTDHRAQDQSLYRRRLDPHRSLSPKGLSTLLLCLGVAGMAASIPFFLLGAWPVVGFFGLDVLILYLAFRANMRAARAYEEIDISHVELRLRKVSAKGAVRDWRFNPSWTRLKTERHEELGMQRIAIEEGRRRIEIGAFLGAEAKEDFAGSFGKALREAKRGRVYNP